MKEATEQKEKIAYTDEEINELAEWLEDLTLKQAFFLKESFQSYLTHNANCHGQEYVH
jgi:uncharacterized protein YpbB